MTNHFFRKHQIDIPGVIVGTVLSAAYAWPGSWWSKLVFPQYEIPSPSVLPSSEGGKNATTEIPGTTEPASTARLYDRGWWDVGFVAFYVIVWTLLRAGIMVYGLSPLARWLGLRRRSQQQRFTEQGWLVMYYTAAFSVGLYVAYTLPSWFHTPSFWIGYPHHMSCTMKVYYLVQLAFWIQQLFVVHIEKRRKDYLQYLIHHIVTIALVVVSYVCNITRMGNAVFVSTDVADILLSAAKCLNYLDWRLLCNMTFAAFVAVWVISRHIVYNVLLWSVAVEWPQYVDMTWDPTRNLYASTPVYVFVTVLLGVLQVLFVIWLMAIVRLVVKVVNKVPNVKDSRSDSEEDSDDEDAKRRPRGKVEEQEKGKGRVKRG